MSGPHCLLGGSYDFRLHVGVFEGFVFQRHGHVAIEKEEPLRQQLASFVDCALTGGEPKVSGSHAAAALELAVEITKRIATA